LPTCPLCSTTEVTWHAEARDIEYCTSDDTFDFHYCDNCAVLFIDPMLSDKLNEIYPSNYYSFAETRRNLAVTIKEWLDKRRFRRVLKPIPGDDLAVLDVGGGTGWLAELVKQSDPRFKRTCVVDIDAESGERAIASGHTYLHARFEHVETAERFDLILMLNLIEHVPDPRAVLKKARSLLTKGGRVLIKTPNFDALDARLFRHRSWAGYHTPRHFVLFKRDSLERLCRECGFHIAEFSYTQGAPFWSVSILEELRRLGLAKISRQRPAVFHPLIPLLQIGSAGFDFLRQPVSKLSQMEFILTGA
jgi:2-polyprenyl-3-methyl-5-hydroxy-6-metoxy-1,4-benzoquinol methylase